MIQLLFTLLAAEVCVVFALLFKTPLRKLAVAGLDRLKRGRGPIVVKTVAGTAVVVLSSSIYSMLKIQSRSSEIGSLTPTDQVLMSRHLLEASLMGYSLFVALTIDRLHQYIRELRGLRKSMEASAKHNRPLEEAKDKRRDAQEEANELKAKVERLEALAESRAKEARSSALKSMEAAAKHNRSLEEAKDKSREAQEEANKLKAKVERLEAESESRAKEARSSKASVTALKKQCDGLLHEYGRLQQENQDLRSQLCSFDRMLSRSDGKKNT